eukprot:3218202-Prymnesium_polylepis.1
MLLNTAARAAAALRAAPLDVPFSRTRQCCWARRATHTRARRVRDGHYVDAGKRFHTLKLELRARLAEVDEASAIV